MVPERCAQSAWLIEFTEIKVIPDSIAGITRKERFYAAEGMPRAVHAHFLTNSAFLWSSLQSSGLTIPVTDLTLKYGGTVPGRWKLLYLVDAWADSGNPPDVTESSGGQMTDGILIAMHGLRTLMGRPQSRVGITPLMIFRSTAGWTPRNSE